MLCPLAVYAVYRQLDNVTETISQVYLVDLCASFFQSEGFSSDPVSLKPREAQGGFRGFWSLCQRFKGKRVSVRQMFMGQGIAKTIMIVDGTRTSPRVFFVRDFHQMDDKARRNL
jgi:hypothetical protein